MCENRLFSALHGLGHQPMLNDKTRFRNHWLTDSTIFCFLFSGCRAFMKELSLSCLQRVAKSLLPLCWTWDLEMRLAL